MADSHSEVKKEDDPHTPEDEEPEKKLTLLDMPVDILQAIFQKVPHPDHSSDMTNMTAHKPE